MLAEYDVWFRDPKVVLQNQLGNPDFKDEFDYAPFQKFDDNGEQNGRTLCLQTGATNKPCNIIAEDAQTHGALFVPVILGSDKTTVSIATGHNEFYPLYISNGNIHNNVRRAHRNGVSVLGFLSIPKTDRKYQDDDKFHIHRCPDGHFCRVIYGLGPYIADYPEQALLACIVQGWCPTPADNLDAESGRRSHAHTDALLEQYSLKILWDDYGIVGTLLSPFTAGFPRADIHELLCSDLLHQIIKGTFKDHLVTWVGEYLVLAHGPAAAAAIMADIDNRIAAAPPFPGQRRFPEGRGFKQWTGDDSKALMKEYLPAINGRCLVAFLEFCYLHSLEHYRRNIQLFGAPNGLCSSITESKHIKAVKEPWRRSSHFEALVDFASHGLLSGVPPFGPDVEPPFGDPDAVPVPGPRVLNVVTLAVTRALAIHINRPINSDLIRRFLFDQLHPDAPLSGDEVNINICPTFNSNIHVFHSALATFYAPNPTLPGFTGLYAVHVCLFFSFKHNRKRYPCALVQWFVPIGDHPCEDTGMWMVEPDFDHRGQCVTAIVHLDTAVRGAHLLPIYGLAFIPHELHFSETLRAFRAYYINKYADHHMHQIAF
ncbi:hypothetical protein BJV74DRAFT_862382 [Russula compacta]|nr:hypothetical protein BJV74DRAFT_862382 [Russula compacta]